MFVLHVYAISNQRGECRASVGQVCDDGDADSSGVFERFGTELRQPDIGRQRLTTRLVNWRYVALMVVPWHPALSSSSSAAAASVTALR